MATLGEVKTGIRSRCHLKITPGPLSPLTPCDDHFLLKANLSGQLGRREEELSSVRCAVCLCVRVLSRHTSPETVDQVSLREAC